MKILKIVMIISDPETIEEYYDEDDEIIIDDLLKEEILLDHIDAEYKILREENNGN